MSENGTLPRINPADTIPKNLDKPEKEKVEKPVSSEDEQRFKKLMQQSIDDERLLKEARAQAAIAAEQATVLANVIAPLPGPAEAPPVAVQKIGNDALQQIIHAVVEKMAVSQNSSNQHQILIQLKDSILPSTHIVIDASNHQLAVQFVTASGQVDTWLKAQQSSLTQELNDRLDRPVNLQFLYAAKETTTELGKTNR